MTRRLSSAYDPYSILIRWVRIGMNDKEKRDGANHSDNVPSLFPMLEPIRENDVQRIIPNTLGDIEATPCLARFLRAFSLSHSNFTAPSY